MRKVLVIAALFLTAGTAFAAGEARVAKVVACENFNEFRDANGVTMGVCGASSPKGKPRILRSYVVTKVVNPSTDTTASVMVGYL
jgi:hypothetical protein